MFTSLFAVPPCVRLLVASDEKPKGPVLTPISETGSESVMRKEPVGRLDHHRLGRAGTLRGKTDENELHRCLS